MTTPQSMRERLVEEILKQFEEIEWRQNLARPTVSEVLSSGKSTTTPQKRHVLDIALTTLEAAAREKGAHHLQAVMDTAVMLHEQDEITDAAFCKLRDLLHAAALTPTNPPNTQV